MHSQLKGCIKIVCTHSSVRTLVGTNGGTAVHVRALRLSEELLRIVAEMAHTKEP